MALDLLPVFQNQGVGGHAARERQQQGQNDMPLRHRFPQRY